MLEHYFVRPETIDRIRASWMGEAIEKYVIWLSEHAYKARCAHHRVPLLIAFGEFARRRGADRIELVADHYTVLETAKLHDIDPAAYLGAAVIAADRGEVLLPWQYTEDA